MQIVQVRQRTLGSLEHSVRVFREGVCVFRQFAMVSHAIRLPKGR